MKIGIIGHGFVGRATARCFMEHAEVQIYDKVPELCTHSAVVVVGVLLIVWGLTKG